MPKMSLWPGFHPDTAGRVYSAGFMGLTYKERGGLLIRVRVIGYWLLTKTASTFTASPLLLLRGGEERRGEGTAERRGGDVKGRGGEKGNGRRGSYRYFFSHFKPWARVTG